MSIPDPKNRQHDYTFHVDCTLHIGLHSFWNQPKNACSIMRLFNCDLRKKTLISVFTNNQRDCIVRKNTD